MDADTSSRTWLTREEIDHYFAQGMVAGRDGLGIESCPYPPPRAEDRSSFAGLCWQEGWGFGRFLLIRQLRKRIPQEIAAAITSLMAYQERYSAWSITEAKGFWRGGFAALLAQWRVGRLAREIRARREFEFLAKVGIEMTLPWGKDHYPYHFQFWDRQLAPLGGHYRNLLRLVDVYGERHGVRAAFLEFTDDALPPGVLSPLE